MNYFEVECELFWSAVSIILIIFVQSVCLTKLGVLSVISL